MYPSRRRRVVRRALLAALVAVVGAGAGYMGLVGQPWTTPVTKLAVTPQPTPVLRPVGTSGPLPTASGLPAALARALADPALGPSVAAVVTDPMSGAVLYDRMGGRAVPPASTAKLATAAAALLTLGPGARLTTRTALAGPTVFLVGDGDPSPDLDALARLTAKSLRDRGISAAHVATDTTAYAGATAAPGWKPIYVTAGDVRPVTALPARAGDEFAQALRAAGVRVAGPVRAGAAPGSAAAVASVQSAPVSLLVQQMLTSSDNNLAEALARHVAKAAGRPMTFADGAAAVTAAVAPLVGDAPLHLVDGSGLSVLDRASPRALARLLTAAAAPGHPELRPIVLGLPVAGATGTLADRYRSPATAAARGLVRAKTGTLEGVSSLAGLVVDASGRLLAFAVVADRAPYYLSAEAALDRVAARIAGCGCR